LRYCVSSWFYYGKVQNGSTDLNETHTRGIKRYNHSGLMDSDDST